MEKSNCREVVATLSQISQQYMTMRCMGRAFSKALNGYVQVRSSKVSFFSFSVHAAPSGAQSFLGNVLLTKKR